MPRLGQYHHNAKLPDVVVRDMRNVYEAWKAAGDGRGYRALAEIFAVSRWTARDIVTYRTRIGA